MPKTKVPLNQLKEMVDKKKEELSENPAAQLINVNLSPNRQHLTLNYDKQADLAASETYCRSAKHPTTQSLKNDAHVYCKDNKTLQRGQNANAGTYGNLIQMLGDTEETEDFTPETTDSDGKLYNHLLEYRQKICQEITNYCANHNHIKVGFYNQYPCIMVKINDSSINRAKETKKPSQPALEAWSNFLISILIGIVNHKAVEQNMPIEMYRRASFGFLQPTVSPTGVSIRINVGIVPKEYASIIASALTSLDGLLQELSTDTTPLSKESFYGSKNHKKYLGKKYPPKVNMKLAQLFFEQVDTGGYTTVQNLMRTPYIREGIAIKMFNALREGKNIISAFKIATEWAINQFQCDKKLTIKQGDAQTVCHEFSRVRSKSKDEIFWSQIKEIVTCAKRLKDPLLKKTISAIEERIEKQSPLDLHRYLEYLHEMLFISAIENSGDTALGDGYGSDSETEGEIRNKKIFSKKIITHGGMRALWRAIIVGANHIGSGVRLFLSGAYYEIPLGLQLIQKLETLPNITLVDSPNESNMILHDLNACSTQGKTYALEEISENKIVILDDTSATATRTKKVLESFATSRAPIAMIAGSGAKNQQIGSDKNQFGTIRFFAKNKSKLNDIYNKAKQYEPPLTSKTSHEHRRKMKKMGAIPRSQHFFDKINKTDSTTIKPMKCRAR